MFQRFTPPSVTFSQTEGEGAGCSAPVQSMAGFVRQLAHLARLVALGLREALHGHEAGSVLLSMS